MKNGKSIKTNAVLNAIKTLLSIIFPLITYPYAARVLHATNLGKVNFAQSVASYFSLIAALGINIYAVREGSKIKNEKYQLNFFCNEVFSINIFTTIVAYLLLILSIVTIPTLKGYGKLIFILSLTMLFTTIGIDWINIIYEDYFIITVRSIIAQIINLISLFIFVRSENDYYIYAFILVLPTIIICIWNFIYCRKYIKIRFVIRLNLKKHIKPLLIFFVNNLAISIYCYADTTMLGWMLGDGYVGIYSVAVKVYTVVKTLLASVYTVCIPRLSNYFGRNKYTAFKVLLNKVMCGLVLILLPAMVGIVMLSNPIILILGGKEYIDAVETLKILSIALVFAILGGVLSNCINIPMGKEKITLIGTIFASIINIILNFILIPIYGQNGAAVTTVIAELTVVIICLILNPEIKKIISLHSLITALLQASIGCVIVIICKLIVFFFITNIVAQCGIVFLLSIFIYLCVLLLLKNDFALSIVGSIKNKMQKI